MKKSVDLNGLDERSKNNSVPLEVKRSASGIAGDAFLEPVPNFIKASNEKVIQGANNAWIVLGRDRPSSRLSGYGGKGHTQAGSIDIVVGRMASTPKSGVNVDPNFEVDAARIYISQKTDVDKNFRLANGKIGQSDAKSAIALKADGLRFIAREGIKIITGTDAKNSQGGTVDTTFGVDLIGGNLSDGDRLVQMFTTAERQKLELQNPGLEPMVKGVSLAFALDQLTENVDKLSGIMGAFLKSQMELNAVAGGHFHISPFFGIPTSPSTELANQAIRTNMELLQDCVIGIQKWKANVVNYKNTHLRQHGRYYFCSKYHSLN